jgi:hypothetical protein
MAISSPKSGKSLNIKELSGEQRRQLIDTQQVFEALRAARHDAKHRFAGSVRWVKRAGGEYLYRKVGSTETSLGPRSGETEATYEAFVRGRDQNNDRLVGLTDRLNQLAPVNAAMNLGRVPTHAARVLKTCDEYGLLDSALTVVGTNAIFAYEVLAGVQASSDLIATGDIDLLYDARRRLSFAVKRELKPNGLIGLIQKTDSSFKAIRPRSYRAANRDGYFLDLIRPEPRDVLLDDLDASLTDHPEDLEAANIAGLGWLMNSRKAEAVAIDERGFPVRLVTVDPRVFALHKAWLSSRQDREPLKARRDREQAAAAAMIAAKYLRLSFDDNSLSALPLALRRLAPSLP